MSEILVNKREIQNECLKKAASGRRRRLDATLEDHFQYSAILDLWLRVSDRDSFF